MAAFKALLTVQQTRDSEDNRSTNRYEIQYDDEQNRWSME